MTTVCSKSCNYSASEQALQEQRKLRTDLQSDVGSSKDRVQEIQKQLEDIVEQLGDARVDKHEDARRKKKQEIVERFKANNPGVVRIFLRIYFVNFLPSLQSLCN